MAVETAEPILEPNRKLFKALPAMNGRIDRRLLLNVRVQPEALAPLVPKPFRLQLVDGWAMAGICLIRMKELKPKYLSFFPGLQSENAAHRIAVEWDAVSGARSGVYVPRRDSTSVLGTLVGGRLFPGVQHRADFVVDETDSSFEVKMASRDKEVSMSVSARVAGAISPDSVFESTEEASEFYKCGSIGYSDTRAADGGRFDGVELVAKSWSVTPLEIVRFESSLFDSLPDNSVELDNGLLMTDIDSQWNSNVSRG